MIAQSLGYKTFESNASDQRNKDCVSGTIGFLKNNRTLSGFSSNGLTEKNLIIMDEVDGMGGNEDKGGISTLIEIIKTTKIPIICICNDPFNQKLKNLITHCYELKFTKPDKRQIVNRLIDICKKEEINLSPTELDFLCESEGCDIRKCLNFLDLKSRSKLNCEIGLKNNYDKYSKDSTVMLNSFEICKRMLNKGSYNKSLFKDKLDLFFVDFDLLPNLIHVFLFFKD